MISNRFSKVMNNKTVAVYCWDNDGYYQCILSILSSCDNVNVVRCQDIDSIKSTNWNFLLLTASSDLEKSARRIKKLIHDSKVRISTGQHHVIKVIFMEFMNDNNSDKVFKNVNELEDLLGEIKDVSRDSFCQRDIMVLNSLPRLARYAF